MGMFLLCLLRCSDDAGIQNLAIDFAGFPVDRFFPTKKSHKYLWEKKAKTPFFPTSTCGIFQTFCGKFPQVLVGISRRERAERAIPTASLPQSFSRVSTSSR